MSLPLKNKNENARGVPGMVRAFRGEKMDTVPFWFMRQAGRYLPEYHKVRKNFDFMALCRDVESSVRVSLQPFERFGMDGIIMFNDILTPLAGAGVRLRFEEKRGPVIEDMISESEDLKLLSDFNAERDTDFVAKIMRSLRENIDALPEGTNRPALLGFAGAPFTVASYLLEGGSTKSFARTKACLYSGGRVYEKLAERLTEITIEYLKMQIDAGADAVQIFDSWGGILSPRDYREFARPYSERLLRELRAMTDAPVILFVGNSAHLLEDMVAQKPSVISLDWRVDPAVACEKIPSEIALQGNMDPLILYGEPERVRSEVQRTLEAFAGRSGYVFNLGHGILPESPLENVEIMCETVQAFRRQ